MLVRLREAVFEVEGLMEKASWVSDDTVAATDLPLAKATERVLASMNQVLTKTKSSRDAEIEKYNTQVGGRNKEHDEKRLRLLTSKAAEVRLVRNIESLKHPEVKFRAETV